jgi:Tn7-like transposition protein D
MHQLVGIVVCSKHSCFLEESTIELGKTSARCFISAEVSIPLNLPTVCKLNPENAIHQMLIKLAHDAEWLITHHNLQINSEVVRDRYYNILLSQGFAYYNGRIRHTKLIKALETVFPKELYQFVGRISQKDNWLTILVQSDTTRITYHPIRHLLLITFLGLTAEEFFTSFIEFKPFGEPPYPCLNRVCKHFKEPVIQECQIYDNLTKSDKYRRPIAIFTCKCGFIYQRLGPDKSEADKFQYSSVREYGSTWEKGFAKLWADLTISAAEIARRIGTSQTSIGRHAIRLNLPMNSQGTRSLQGYKRHRNPRTSFSTLKKEYRTEWLKVRKSYPKLTRQELMNTANFHYLWLRRNDSDWFEKNLPSVAKIPKNIEHLNWNEIDLTISKKVKIVCKEIRETTGFPIRISITEIIRRVENKGWIDKRQRKLPLTTKIIDKNLESIEDYMLRKLDWAKKQFIEEMKLANRNRLRTVAVIRNEISDNSPNIQKAIDDALVEIKNSIY